MLDFIRDELQFLFLIPIWLVSGIYLGPLAYLIIPGSFFLLKGREMYPEVLMGFLLVLILSDMSPYILNMLWVKKVKHAVMVAVALVFILDRDKFAPHSNIFSIFLPFVVYCFIPIIHSPDPVTAIQKGISYSLLLLIVPNYVVYSFRSIGWSFFRNLIFFIVSILLVGFLLRYVNPALVTMDGRFRAFFGNPNGLGIFAYLMVVLFTLLNFINKELFVFREKVLVYIALFGVLLLCGSRTSLVSTVIFLVFIRTFRISPYFGFFTFIFFLVAMEVVSSNLAAIVIALGLEDYMRIETLEDGSGRYIAWNFAWGKIQEYLLMGGGFGTDEWVMRRNYEYLQKLGHHGGVHNSYLTMWFNVGIIGVLIYFRSFILIFIRASKRVPVAFPIMFSVLFSVIYESWLNGSLNPFTITLLISLTIISEEEIFNYQELQKAPAEEEILEVQVAEEPVSGLRSSF